MQYLIQIFDFFAWIFFWYTLTSFYIYYFLCSKGGTYWDIQKIIITLLTQRLSRVYTIDYSYYWQLSEHSLASVLCSSSNNNLTIITIHTRERTHVDSNISITTRRRTGVYTVMLIMVILQSTSKVIIGIYFLIMI